MKRFTKRCTTPSRMFAEEARGLDWLRGVDDLKVPEVISVSDTELVLEWLDLGGRPDLARFGRALATLHQRGAPCFGLDRDNWLVEAIPQDNTPAPDIATFFLERRLKPLAERVGIAIDIPADRFGPPEPPARLHGDLWWGNVGSVGGVPAIFDPAVYGGHREIDLAMLDLFGGLPDELIAAYQEIAPLSPGWRERIPLWQLYPLLAHAILFGGSYARRAADIVRAL